LHVLHPFTQQPEDIGHFSCRHIEKPAYMNFMPRELIVTIDAFPFTHYKTARFGGFAAGQTKKQAITEIFNHGLHRRRPEREKPALSAAEGRYEIRNCLAFYTDCIIIVVHKINVRYIW